MARVIIAESADADTDFILADLAHEAAKLMTVSRATLYRTLRCEAA